MKKLIIPDTDGKRSDILIPYDDKPRYQELTKWAREYCEKEKQKGMHCTVTLMADMENIIRKISYYRAVTNSWSTNPAIITSEAGITTDAPVKNASYRYHESDNKTFEITINAILENDGTIKEQKPVPLVFGIMKEMGSFCIVCLGKDFWDRNHGWADGPEIHREHYNYYYEIAQNLSELGCGKMMESLFCCPNTPEAFSGIMIDMQRKGYIMYNDPALNDNDDNDVVQFVKRLQELMPGHITP